NGGPFVPWLVATTQTSASYTGSFGHTYRFYTEAVDNVGNRENKNGQQDTESRAGQAPTLPARVQMVGLPIQSDVVDPLAVFGFTNGAWVRYDPSANGGKGDYVAYGSDSAGFTRFANGAAVPGKGYWLKLDKGMAPKASGPLLDSTKSHAIPLK